MGRIGRRLGAVLAVIVCLCGLGAAGPRAAAAPRRPDHPCQPYAPGHAPAGSRAYRVPKLKDPGAPPRCDLSDMAIATHDDGLFRGVYGDDGAVAPDDAVRPVIERLKRQVRCDEATNLCTLRILVFAHGGLVPHGDAVDLAEALAPAMMADGYAPVFLIWNSDFLTSYGSRLCCVTQGETDRNPIHWLYFFPTRLAGDLVAGAARAPENYGLQAIRFHDSVLANGGDQYFLAPGDARAICAEVRPCPQIRYPGFGGPHRDRLLNGLDQPIPERSFEYSLGFPVRLGTTVIAPQIGAAAWDNMVRRTRLAVQDTTLGIADQSSAAADLARLDVGYAARLNSAADRCERQTIAAGASAEMARRSDPRRRFSTSGEGAFLIFFDRLACEIEAGGFTDPTGRNRPVSIQIDYFGHSMGALIGNEVLARHPELPWRRIVYMAAATPTRDVRLMVSTIFEDHLADHPQVRFYNLMLHPLAESHDLEVHGAVPEGSLLEWIDEMFGGPRTVDDRMFGKWTNAEKTMAGFKPQVRERMTFRVFPAQDVLNRRGAAAARARAAGDEEQLEFDRQCALMDGVPEPKRCHPIRHGEFVDYAFWRDRYLCAEDDCDAPDPRRP